MYKYSKSGVSILSVLDTRRVKKNGMYPVKIQVVYKRKQKYYSTGKDLREEDWKRLSTTKLSALIEIREDVESSFSTIKKSVCDLMAIGRFTFELLDIRLGKYSSGNINDAFNAKIETLYKNGQINSYINYKSALRAFERFAGKTILFDDITPDWLRSCEMFWKREGMSYSSMSFYFRDLKSIINVAKNDSIISETQYPFGRGKYEIPKGNSRKLALSIKELKLLSNYQCKNKKMEEFRDLWLFSYLCNGINFRDLLFLKYSDIVNNEICFVRAKTARSRAFSKLIQASITPQMEEIINKWGCKSKDAYIFRFIKGDENEYRKAYLVKYVISQCNKVLASISNELELPKITTYAARHSFATVLKRSGVNVSYISECLGHSSIAITENYLASFDFDERKKNSLLLTKFE